MTDSEVFTDKIADLFVQQPMIRKIDSTTPGLPPVSCFIFHGVPDAGMTTAVTYGLSEADHPDWRFGKPELTVTVKSTSESWALAAAFFAEQYRGGQSFTYGSMFMLNERISPESEMSGFLVFTPATLNSVLLRIELPTKTINLAGMYPIYAGEAELLREIGLEEFWRLPGLDLLDVKREDMSKVK
jgi:hypothetical protein